MVVQQDKSPRIEPIPGGGTAFIHPCSVCGSSLAFYGFKVNLRSGKPGDWRCYDHRVDNLQTSVPVKPKSQTASEPKSMPEPQQGDLF